jgi:hypothetical protein
MSASLVSLIGVMASVKGAALMIAPEFGSDLTYAIITAPGVLTAAIGLDLVLGLWLSSVGWPRSRPA